MSKKQKIDDLKEALKTKPFIILNVGKDDPKE